MRKRYIMHHTASSSNTFQICLLISYDGAPYQGWQSQKNCQGIQDYIEKAIQVVTGMRIPLLGASRTDRGVHANGQVAVFNPPMEVDAKIPGEIWKGILNFYLPQSIRIVASKKVPYSFHPQKDALSKDYLYRVLISPDLSPLDTRLWHFPCKEINLSAIEEGLYLIQGAHNFISFRGSQSNTYQSTMKTIYRAWIRDEGGGLFHIWINGDGFLKHMVRILIGTLMDIGRNKKTIDDLKDLLTGSQPRQSAGRTAPSHGLFLMRIYYPESKNPFFI